MWMVEVEVASSQLKDSINCANEFFKCLCKWVLENCSEDIKFVAKRIDNTCIYRLEQMVSSSSEMVSYNEAIEVLRKVESKKFQTNLEFGVALTTEHLSYLVDHIYKRPVIIYNFPKEAKPFYVRLNDDGKTVAAFDMVVPKIWSKGGIKELGLPREKYEWCLGFHLHGTVKHSGFTLRLDLVVLYVTGLGNVRDVIPFPRSYRRVGGSVMKTRSRKEF